jgi:hypothetical protein
LHVVGTGRNAVNAHLLGYAGGLGAEMVRVEEDIAAAHDMEGNLAMAASSGYRQPARSDIPPPPKFDGTSTATWQAPEQEQLATYATMLLLTASIQHLFSWFVCCGS